jgi:hypothetical protein
MPNAYPDDVKEAVLAAMKRFEKKEKGEFVQHFEVGEVTVMFAVREGSGPTGDRWDYGHPTMYTLDTGHVAKLEEWWREVAPTGALLPRQYKGPINAYEVNLVYDSGSRRFNYHVAVP